MNSDVLDREDRESAAYHEAGHAVIALFHRWEISPEGVEIDDRQYTGLRCRLWQMALEAPSVIISLAGVRAECKWRRLKHSPSDEGLLDIIEAVRFGYDDEAEGDHGDAFRHLIGLYPNARDEELIELYRRYEGETLALLETPHLWAKIELFAAELVARGKISATLAERLYFDTLIT
jgi:hypothetical protein